MMVDLRVDDPRVPALVDLGLPAVVVGGPLEGGRWRRSGTTSGRRSTRSCATWRRSAIRASPACRSRRLRPHRPANAGLRGDHARLGLLGQVVQTDYTPESGSRATRRLLSQRDRPTGIVYDSDVLAVTGLGVAHQMGLSVPDDVSIVAWDDSLICQVVHPPLTALTRDISPTALPPRACCSPRSTARAAATSSRPRAELLPRGSTGPVR